MSNHAAKLFDWIMQRKHMDNWFKWLEWVTLTAAFGAAYWFTKNQWLGALTAISGIYIWYSAVQGFGYVFWSVFARFNPNKSTILAISQVVGPIFGFFVLYVLFFAFKGLLEIGSST